MTHLTGYLLIIGGTFLTHAVMVIALVIALVGKKKPG